MFATCGRIPWEAPTIEILFALGYLISEKAIPNYINYKYYNFKIAIARKRKSNI
jgi:hypothetical protein